MHVPTLPGCAHDWQRPEQSERQQILSKQWPLLQSSSIVQVAPTSAPGATEPPAPAAPPPVPPTDPPALPPRPPTAVSIGASGGGDPSGLRDSPAPPQLAPATTSASKSSSRDRMEGPEMGVRSAAGRATNPYESRGYLGLSSSSGTSAKPHARS